MTDQLSNRNECGRTRDKDDPYEVWRWDTPDGPWEWRVLKKYQSPKGEAANKYARWYCYVTSPYAREYGDVYVSDITDKATKVEV